MAHVAEYKKRIVENIVKLAKEYPIVGAVNMENLPAPQLQAMKAQLRGKVVLVMTKKRLIKIALEKLKSERKAGRAPEWHACPHLHGRKPLQAKQNTAEKQEQGSCKRRPDCSKGYYG